MDAELLNWTRRRLVVTKSLPMKLMITKSRMCLTRKKIVERMSRRKKMLMQILKEV